METQTWLAERFDRDRGHLRAVAYRMLGSLDEADDAVQETWLRAARADAAEIANVTGWLTTIVGRVCLDMLRARRRRNEDLTADPVAAVASGADPEEEAVLAESVGLALLVVLDALGPAERVAFVLHDLFAVPFAEIAAILDRSPAAAKKLASRARLRVKGGSAAPGCERRREVVAAFLTASRAGDLEALLAVLAPDVLRRTDRPAPGEARGARRIAEETLTNTGLARFAALALVDGAPGIVVAPRGRLLLVLRVTVGSGRVTEVDVIGDPGRLRALRLALL
jgi:RNA polymerase sigma factor (sigma-70 family)